MSQGSHNQFWHPHLSAPFLHMHSTFPSHPMVFFSFSFGDGLHVFVWQWVHIMSIYSLLLLLLMLILKQHYVIVLYLYMPKGTTLLEAKEKKLSRPGNLQFGKQCFLVFFFFLDLLFCNTVWITNKYIKVQFDSSVWRWLGALNNDSISILSICVSCCGRLLSPIKF